MKQFLLFCYALALSSPAWAEPYTYGPNECEFQITFPEKPFIEKKCSQNITNCAEVATYTKAISTGESAHFRVSCNPLLAADIEKYTPDIMKETLIQLTKANNLVPYNSDASEKDGYKNASTVSLSEKDGKPLIYNGQIWIGKKSMFTIEAEIVGQDDQTDKIFADILRSGRAKDQAPAKEDAPKDPSPEPASKAPSKPE